MSSIGIDLQRWVTKNLLKFHASRPTAYGLETHLAMMRKLVTEFRPSVVTVDSITNLIYVASAVDVHAALMQLIDSLKNDQITCLLTSVTETSTARKHTVVSISSLIDSWIVLRDIESTGERNRGIQVLKSRGMAHSNQIREFRITSAGLQLSDVDAGSAGVLTGTARVGQEKEDKTEAIARQLGRKQREIARKKRVLDGRIAALQAEFIAALQAEFEEEKEEL